MTTSSSFLINFAILANTILISIGVLAACPALAESPLLAGLTPPPPLEFRNPFLPPPNPWKPAEVKWPELYIEPTLRHGLSLVLPQPIHNGLNVDAGYDRVRHVPTFKADYFLLVKGWNDKSLFLSPRFSLDGKNESLSFGGGFRHLLTSETMIGFHAFHDWVKPRGTRKEFLKEVGMGFELSALPGRFSDISLSVNAYFPVNERLTFAQDGALLVKEKLPVGMDAKLAFLLPALVNWLDLRMDATVHSYRGDRIQLDGHKATLAANTRDGMLQASVSHETDTFRGENFLVEGSLRLAFDWNEAIQGRMPFSAPYKVPTMRFERKMRDGLYDRIVRKHDLPCDRTEKRLALAARVNDQIVLFDGGFPDLPNSRLTVQISQSPWRDAADVTTDSAGGYEGKINLPPGKYKFRVMHKATGRVSEVRTLVIEDQSPSQ